MPSLGMHDLEKEEQGPREGFRFEDRRGLDANGERRAVKNRTSSGSEGDDSPAAEAAEVRQEGSLFLQWIVGMGAQAYAALGQMEDPLTGERAVHLDAARQVIDLLGILREKTTGNLTPMEREVLDRQLTELRLLFVTVKEQGEDSA